MSETLNRATADKLAKQLSRCHCKECVQSVSDRIFTELQIAQKRGEVVMQVQVRGMRCCGNCVKYNDCEIRSRFPSDEANACNNWQPKERRQG